MSCKHAKPRSQRGAAAVMVLSVILLLTVLGIVALLAAMSNVKMGARYARWSEEYYALDALAEERVESYEKSLARAERLAQTYLQNSFYITAALPTVDAVNDEPNVQELKGALPAQVQSILFARWDLSVESIDIRDKDAYNSALKKYMEESFQILYYYFASKSLPDTYTEADLTARGLRYKDTVTRTGLDYRELDTMSFDPDDDWERLIPAATEDARISLRIAVEELPAEAGDKIRKLIARLDVVRPEYVVGTKQKSVPYQGNPIWTYALAADEGIAFTGGGAAQVYGDLFSAASDQPAVIPEGVLNSGIRTTGADVEVYGNVYSRGDLHVTGNGGSISVFPYSATVPVHKYNMFGESTLCFDSNAVTMSFSQYTESGVTGIPPEVRPIPLVYNDHTGGNVYSNNLSVESNVLNGSISVSGLAMTQDDVQMDGKKSEIVINGNYIGINSAAVGGNPNASSSVINNQPVGDDASAIELLGNFIIPGTAFIKFDGNVYYQTAESASGKNPDIFLAYSDPYEGSVAFAYDSYTLTEGGLTDTYGLVSGVAPVTNPSDKGFFQTRNQSLLDALIGFFSTGNLKSGVRVNNDVEGYMLGAVIAENSSGNSVIYSKNNDDALKYMVNRTAYNTMSGALSDIFDVKTRHLGAGGGWTIESLVQKGGVTDSSPSTMLSIPAGATDNEFYYFSGDVTLSLQNAASRFNGILYCDGNVTLQGAGQIRGSIISGGSITVDCSGGITIYNDENVIEGLLANEQKIRNFFSPAGLNLASPAFYISDPAAVAEGSGARSSTFSKRMKVVSWVQSGN